MGGKPRTYDRDDVEEKLLNWVKKEEAINMMGFSAEHLIPPSVILKWVRADPDGFGQTYDTVRSIIGMRREQRLSEGTLHTKAYDLNSSHYDRYLKEDQKEDKSFEIKSKVEAFKNVDPEDTARLTTAMSIIDQLQSLASERKIADTSIITEEKS